MGQKAACLASPDAHMPEITNFLHVLFDMHEWSIDISGPEFIECFDIKTFKSNTGI